MRLPLRLALRYVFKPRSRKLVHIISGISMFVIAMVTTAMIVVLSAFNGLEELVSELFGTLDADVALVPKSGEVVPEGLAFQLENSEHIAHYSAIIESEAIISANGSSEICTILGVDSNYKNVAPVEDAIIAGEWGEDCCVIGYGIKSMLRLPAESKMDETVVIGAPVRGKKLSRHKEAAFRNMPATACGTFSINADLDMRYVIAPLGFASELFGREGEVSRFEIKLSDGSNAEDLEGLVGEDYRFRTRAEKHRFITQTNRAEKWATFVILSFILIVAAFNVLASLTMMLIEKKDDLSIFKAMGMRSRDLELTFSIQGLAINIFGGVIGAVLGIGLVWAQTQWGFITLEGSVVPAYPVLLKYGDVVGTLSVVIGIGGLGSAAMVRFLIRKIVV